VITEVRILPPLAIARLGAAPSPMDNYDVLVDPERPLGMRTLRAAPTLRVDATTGAITAATTPDTMRFTDAGRVRPVAPFLEVWARVDGGDLEPLTTTVLAADGLDASDVQWQVDVANHKAARRTGDADDRITATTGPLSDHAPHRLDGTSPNFWAGTVVPFGSVRYIRPTDDFPEIRLRFTPAAGHVYGASTTAPAGPSTDPNLRAVVYDATRGGWARHVDGADGTPSPTAPGGIYAAGAGGVSRGYLDDACDGVVRVTLTTGGQERSALARVGSGPPAYSPQSMPIRSVLHELEQVLHGPSVAPADARAADVEEIVRRAFESVRLMHTGVLNGPNAGMSAHDAGSGRRSEAIMSPALVDTAALETLHESLLAALRAGTAPWFADVLRTYDQVGDLTNAGRRRMPAMMRGADGQHPALTRRQVDQVETLVRGLVFPPDAPEDP